MTHALQLAAAHLQPRQTLSILLPNGPVSSNACPHPMSRADGLVRGPGAGAEVELLDGEALVVETDVVRPAGRPVLHVPQVGVSIDQHVSAAEQRRRSETAAALPYGRGRLCNEGVPAVQRGAVAGHRERGEPPLELPEPRPGGDVGAQQVATVNVPEKAKTQTSQRAQPGRGQSCRPGGTRSLFVTLDPGVFVLPTVAFLRPFDVQLLVTELVGCRRL